MTTNDAELVTQLERLLGRTLSPNEVALARSLAAEKSPEMIARELDGAPVTDPKKIRPEHKDTANE